MLDLGTLIILVTGVVLFYWLWNDVILRRNYPPGPIGLPFVGDLNMGKMTRKGKRYQYFTDLHNRYGDIICLELFGTKIVCLRGFQLINEAFVKMADYFSDRPTNSGVVRQVIVQHGEGIVQSNGALNKDLRKFALQTMRGMGLGKISLEQRVQEEASFVIAELENQNGQEFDCSSLLQSAVSNVICGITFGRRFDYEDPEFRRLLDLVKAQFSTPLPFFQRLIPQFLTPLALKLFPNLRTLVNCNLEYYRFLRKQVEDHRKSFDPDNIRDFTDLYIQEQMKSAEDREVAITEGNVFRSIIDLFLAGTDTTSMTLLWAVLYMMHHPAILKRVQEELDEVVGRSRTPSVSDRSKLPFTEAVILEIQRVSCIAPQTVPHTVRQDVKLGGYVIPKDSVVFASIYSSHFSEADFPDAHRFNPDRWIDQSGKKLRKFEAFMPFSMGRRVCLGEQLARLELFIFFTSIVQHLDIVAPGHKGTPLPSTEPIQGITLAPKPFKAVFLKRA